MTDQPTKIAIITGGASGIGLAIAREFTLNNIFAILISRDQDKLNSACSQLGPLAAGVSFDLTNLSAIPALVEQLAEEYGHADILVNNAGINMKKEFCEVSDADFQQIMLTNVFSMFTLSREIARKMITRKSGCIINISSMAAQYGIPKVIAYSASKSAIDGMTRAMAVELSPQGIRVNAIAPGFIATDMSAKALDSDPERKHKVLSRTPMGHLGEPADIGKTAVFLASDAAKYITGVILPVDGGNSVGF